MPLKLLKVTKRKTFHSITLGHICRDYSKRGDRIESEFNTVMFDLKKKKKKKITCKTRSHPEPQNGSAEYFT